MSTPRDCDYYLGGSFSDAAKTSTRDISEQEGNFMVNVSIGTPPQNFLLSVRHDRTETYVRSKDCGTGVCPDHTSFDGSKSSTYKGYLNYTQCCLGNTDDGYAFPANDNIVLGDVTIRQAMFAVVVNNTLDRTERESVHYDGVLGAVRAIAWSSKLCSGLGLLKPSQLIKTNPFTVPILTAAHKQRAVDKTMYTIWLQRQEGGDCEQSKAFLPVVGSLTLGDVNKNKCASSEIKWHKLTHTYTLSSYGDEWLIDYATNVDQISYGGYAYTLDNKTAWAAKFAPQSEAVLRAPSTITDDI
ncbi:cathepsin D, partial [Aphelenchoides avenae]